jgi:hypothetical protein
MNITALYVIVDDFCKLYETFKCEKLLICNKKRQRTGYLSLSEMLTIELFYHLSGYQNFKKYC